MKRLLLIVLALALVQLFLTLALKAGQPASTEAAREVGPSLFYSLLVITVSFIPVFTLQAQEGRLFKPLAFT